MHLTRRYFLKSSGAVAAYLGVSPTLAMGSAGVTTRSVAGGKTIVVIFLRGGADGLNLVVPHGDPHYNSLRQVLRVGAPGGGEGKAIDLDGTFGLHPRLASLKPWFDSGHAIAAHAVGYAHNTRSHFEEQDVWETGIIGNTVGSDGWLNRHLATSEGTGPVRAVAVGDALPRILHGRAPAYAIRGVSDLTLPGEGKNRERMLAALEHAYRVEPGAHSGDARQVVHEAGSTTLAGIEQLGAIASEDYKPDASYPQTELARRLQQVARLIKADVGLEVAEVDFGGWDTHANQGQGAGGTFGTLAQTLGDAVSAFCRDLGARLDDTLVVTLTDFGRTAAENGTRGTDHGWANCMFLVGGAVRRGPAAGEGRKIVANWPGLAPDQLHEGRDLLHTTDFRDVLAELVTSHLGNDNLQKLLPGHEFKRVGLIA